MHTKKIVSKGLRIRGEHVPKVVKDACIRYAKWLRKHYVFFIRVPIYLKPTKYIKSINGELVSASFFAPYNKTVEPYIRVAVGHYCEDRKKKGRYKALAIILHSISHELVHYFQWGEKFESTERNVSRKASIMVNQYLEMVENP
ncbi:MAG: TPR-repeat-containing protein [uncultured bacterium]|nr:MAG: TPR-repeat-containing protein [uncultured bacterium]